MASGLVGLSLCLAPTLVVFTVTPLPKLILHQAPPTETRVPVDGEGGQWGCQTPACCLSLSQSIPPSQGTPVTGFRFYVAALPVAGTTRRVGLDGAV